MHFLEGTCPAPEGKMDSLKELDIASVVQAAIEKHGATRDALIPILSEVNRAFGYIPEQATAEIRHLVHSPDEGLFLADSHIFAITSFYELLSNTPVGKHVVRFCESAPCHVQGGRQVIKALQQELHLNPGETSPDKKWTLMTTSCLGVCGVGPVILVDEDLYGNITPDKIQTILARYR
jgi:NADH-quinone oxidoreductase subunit E